MKIHIAKKFIFICSYSDFPTGVTVYFFLIDLLLYNEGKITEFASPP